MIEPRREVSLPAAVAAATGGFLLGVAAFVLVKILRRPQARALRLAAGPGAASARTWPPRARSSSTSTCSRTDSRHARAGRGAHGALPDARRRAATACCVRRGRRSCAAAAPRAASRCSCAPGPAGGAVRFRAEAPAARRGRQGIERMRFALGTDHDLSEFHAPLSPRPADRARDPPPALGAAAPAPRALRGTGLGGVRAADRVAPRRRDRARDRAPATGAAAPAALLRAALGGRRLAGRAPAELDACGLAPKRSMALIRAAREVASGRADLQAPRALLAAPAGHPQHRQLDDRDAGLRGPGPRRHAARARPGLRQAGGQLGRPGPARHRGGGPRVLRSLRRVRRAGGHVRAPASLCTPARRNIDGMADGKGREDR